MEKEKCIGSKDLAMAVQQENSLCLSFRVITHPHYYYYYYY